MAKIQPCRDSNPDREWPYQNQRPASVNRKPLLNEGNTPQRIKTSADPLPDGESFVIKAPDRSLVSGHYRCMVLLVLTPIGFMAGFILCLMPWMVGKSQYAMSTILFGIGTILSIVGGCLACGCCPFQRNAEKWLRYGMTISIEESIIYIVNSSTKNRWKIIHKIPFSNLRSIGTKWHTKSRGIITYQENAWVILVLSDGRKITMNEKPFEISQTKYFVQEVNKYLEQVYQQRQIQIQQNNRQFIEQLVQNEAIVVRNDADRGESSSQAASKSVISESGNQGAHDSPNNPTLESNKANKRNCANCGGTYSIGYKFCPHCGSKINM